MSENRKKYNNCYLEVFEIDEEDLQDASYKQILGWDSVGHMELMQEIEDTFEVCLATEDMIAFSSYVKGEEILRNYGVLL